MALPSRTVVFASLALCGLSQATPASACSCMPRSEAAIIEAADVVIAGKVVDVRRAGQGSILATLDVARIVKGRVHRQIQVRTPDNPAACGLDFAEGQLVRVAATRFNDGLNTNLCMALSPPSPPR